MLFLDSDVLVGKNMDALFDASTVGTSFAAAEGAIAPLNAGVWVATPSCQVFADVNDVASGRSFTREGGWQQAGGRDWSFWSASVDQGLLYHAFFGPGGAPKDGAVLLPRGAFDGYVTHFVGKSKPVPQNKIPQQSTHFSRWDARAPLLCTAMAWMFIPRYVLLCTIP